MTEQKRDGKGRRWLAVVLVLLLLVLLVLFGAVLWLDMIRGGGSGGRVSDSADTSLATDTVLVADTALPADTLALPGDSALAAADTLGTDQSEAARGDTAKPPPRTVPRDTGEATQADTDTTMALSDSLVDTLKSVSSMLSDSAPQPCASDTVAPWVYPDPSGGLHRKAITVVLVGDEPCEIEWRTDTTAAWREYGGEPIAIERTTTLHYRAVDTCGNAMEAQDELYEIKPGEHTNRCPADMELVAIGETAFCVDRYEWPNRKGAYPAAFVSIYQAMDSCMTADKRLCTSDEWKLACSGPYGWRYPYGDRFELRACVTQDTAAARAGSRPECRGYFEVFDMSGNLLEWTSTRSKANNRFYDVMGGFWDSGSQSSCFDSRYSYFPQNRHNPVGFRCCADALSPTR
ncbi:MAG: SUMF1/EgtB/PvdO family nonheme iron enzyme [Chitinivibrionales bacterium]|nr:SUMF1/EgtB/PvdO family nonheme iron enzyme [Chitinivibrionales bacterium]